MDNSTTALPAVERGGLMPHIEFNTIDGGRVRYADLWQRRNLILVMLPDTVSGSDSWVREVIDRRQAFAAQDTTCLLTRDEVVALSRPAVVIADRWGEIIHVIESAALPAPSDLVDWAAYVQIRCPECEGEVK